jgi:hypothetical protein
MDVLHPRCCGLDLGKIAIALIDSDRPILSLRDGLFSTLTAQLPVGVMRRKAAQTSSGLFL